jgi:hypothetical protein
MCQFFYIQRASARRAHELQIAACSQHWSLADDNLKERHGNLADFRSTREDLVGVLADVTRLDQRSVSVGAHRGATPTRKRKRLHVVNFCQPYAKLTTGAPGRLWKVGHTDQELDVLRKRERVSNACKSRPEAGSRHLCRISLHLQGSR